MASAHKRQRGIDDVGGTADFSQDRRRVGHPKKVKTQVHIPTHKATVMRLARDIFPNNVSEVGDHIMDRIRKCLERANHPNTPELEAKAALFLSSRLMTQYNVTHADLLAKNADGDCTQHGGISIVKIQRTKEGANTNRQGWVSTLAYAMNTFFQCKSYATKMRNSIECSFYGIAENTVLAAVAFEIAYNKILDWVKDYTGVTRSFSYCSGVAKGLYDQAKAERQREREEVRRKELEKLEAQLREAQRLREEKERAIALGVSNLADRYNATAETEVLDDTSSQSVQKELHTVDDVSSPADMAEHDPMWDEDAASSDDSVPGPGEDDGSDMDCEVDFRFDAAETLNLDTDLDGEIRRFIKQENPLTPGADGLATTVSIEAHIQEIASRNVKHEAIAAEEERTIPSDVTWASEMQLVQFYKSAEQIAEGVLKSQNIKFKTHKRRARTAVKDRGAYYQGKEDSKKIDVRQKLVED